MGEHSLDWTLQGLLYRVGRPLYCLYRLVLGAPCHGGAHGCLYRCVVPAVRQPQSVAVQRRRGEDVDEVGGRRLQGGQGVRLATQVNLCECRA